MNKHLKSIFQVTLSNFSTIASGVFVGFFLPKLLPVESYGLYKTFTLYATYLGLFSLGIIDGIVLKYGEKNYEDLDRSLFSAYFKWYFLIHIFFALVICACIPFVSNHEYRFIILALGIYLISNNITGYFQQISQITMRFKELSIRKVLQSISNVFIVGILFVIYWCGLSVTYHYYLLLWLIVNVILTLWYVYTYREIVFSEALTLHETRHDIIQLILIGFPLLFANLCSSLILTLDRQFVNILFDTATYAIYAFAYNLLTIVTVATSSISIVLYPVLKRTNKENLKDNYDLLISFMLCFLFGTLISYFPLSIFIKVFLPKYIDSILIFRIIFPGLAISSSVTVIMHNYYKVFGDNFTFFKKSIVVLLVSGIANYIAYIYFHTSISISAASILTMIFWYIYIEQYFVQKSGYRRTKNLIYLLSCSMFFYMTSFLSLEIIGMVSYAVIWLLITFIFYKKNFKNMLLLFKRL